MCHSLYDHQPFRYFSIPIVQSPGYIGGPLGKMAACPCKGKWEGLFHSQWSGGSEKSLGIDNDVTEVRCHSSSSLPLPSPALSRARYPFPAGWTERVSEKCHAQVVLNPGPPASVKSILTTWSATASSSLYEDLWDIPVMRCCGTHGHLPGSDNNKSFIKPIFSLELKVASCPPLVSHESFAVL